VDVPAVFEGFILAELDDLRKWRQLAALADGIIVGIAGFLALGEVARRSSGISRRARRNRPQEEVSGPNV